MSLSNLQKLRNAKLSSQQKPQQSSTNPKFVIGHQHTSQMVREETSIKKSFGCAPKGEIPNTLKQTGHPVGTWLKNQYGEYWQVVENLSSQYYLRTKSGSSQYLMKVASGKYKPVENPYAT